MRRPGHALTTAHLGAAYPFGAERGHGAAGVLIGRDLLGGPFAYDPFGLYRGGVLSNPNMLVFGQIGRGKSAFVKSYLFRQAVFGRRAFVIDPKGEYGPLCRALGSEPVVLRPGGPVRVNPLELPAPDPDTSAAPAPAGAAPEPGRGNGRTGNDGRSRLELLAALAGACLGRRLAPSEHAALELALAQATGALRGSRGEAATPTLPDVVTALLEPSEQSASVIGASAASLRADGRDLALELRRMVTGDLRGMFDGPTSPGIDVCGRIVVLDLSSVYHSPALGALMTCATAWLQATLLRSDGGQTVLVVDEAWAILADVGVARWLQASWKLSRARGVANVAVLHRASDLRAAGAAGSEQAQLAEGLLADSETHVVYAQPAGELEGARNVLGLGETEVSVLAGLGRGVALWRVGRRPFLVEHRLSPAEAEIVDSDSRMSSRGAR